MSNFAYDNKPYLTMRTLIASLCLAATGAAFAANPILPMWEYIPDGEPYVFEDPDNPGRYRVYLYGSHDNLITEYCGRDQVVWSAPVENLNDWRFDGRILVVDRDRDGRLLYANGQGDVLFAPDVAVRTEADGTRMYYLYPNDQAWGRNGLVAASRRPDGPFKIINWSAGNPRDTDGVLRFDPAVFVDDDGRVYGYWGFEKSYGAELDPATMATVRPGTEIVENLIPGRDSDEPFRFFEASSMRKIKDKYVLIYSRWTAEGDFGLPQTNYTLAYAYGDNPLGPFTYGGTIIDGRGRRTLPDGRVVYTAHPAGNTHGSICEIGGRWYVFYHRQTGTSEFARQAMAAPVEVSVQEGPGGKVTISEAEFTSEGFETEGLDPLRRHSAGIACYYTHPRGAGQGYPRYFFNGSYVETNRPKIEQGDKPYDLRVNHMPVVNNTDGSVVGFKYFRLDSLADAPAPALLLGVTPGSASGRIDVVLDDPDNGTEIGSIALEPAAKAEPTELRIPLSGLRGLHGKHALYLRFHTAPADSSLCTLESLVFVRE